MNRFTVYFETGASIRVEVEASDEEAAVDAAREVAPTQVCAHCGGWGKGYSLDLGDWDVEEIVEMDA